MTELVKRPQAPVQGDPVQLGQVLADSGYFEDAKDAAKAAVKVMTALELGLGPVAGMTGVHIIKGKPSISANLMAALVRRHPGYDYKVEELTDQRCAIRFFQNGQPLEPVSEFSMDDAKRAGLNTQNWRQYPRNMLFARAMSNGVTFHCPDVTAGAPIYTPDELGAEVHGETGEPVVEGEVMGLPVAAVEPPPETIDPAWASQLMDRVREKGLKMPEVRALLGLVYGTRPQSWDKAQIEQGFAMLSPENAKALEQELAQ